MMLRWVLTLSILLTVTAQADTAELATIELHHRLPQEMAELVRPLLNPGETVIAGPSGLIVKAGLGRIQEISTLVQELDKRQHRLLVTVAQGRGLTRETLDARASVRTHADSQGNIDIGGRGHLYQTESLENGGQTQRVQTLDGQAANISFGQQIALPQGGVAYGYPGGPAIISQGIQYRDATTGFSVLPRLTGDGAILEISPWSDRIGRGGIGSIATQSADTTVKVRLGEWVEIGGQVENREQHRDGLLAHEYSTRSEANRIFIKVDDLDAP